MSTNTTVNDTDLYLTDSEVETVVGLQLATAALSTFASLLVVLVMLWLNQLHHMTSRIIFALIVCCCFYGVSYLFGAAHMDDPDVVDDRV